MSGTYSPTWQRGKKAVAGGEWVLCTAMLCPEGAGGRPLARNRFLRPQKFLLVVDWGKVVGNLGYHGSARYTRDFLARIRNLRNLIADSACLGRKAQTIDIKMCYKTD